MRSKLMGLLVVLALLLGTFGTAFAQDTAKPFCGDLSEEDCALLQGAQEAMMDVSSYKAAATYDAMLAGIPGLPADEINVNVAVDGAFAFDDAAMAVANEVSGMDQQAVSKAMAENPAMLADLLGGMSADLTLDAKLTPELAEALSAQAGVQIPDTASIGLIMSGGVLYVDASEFAALGAPEGWIGVPVGELLQTQIDAGAFDNAGAQLEAAQADPSMAASVAIQSIVTGQAKDLEQFTSVSRGEDAEVDGTAVAVFDTTVDLAGFVASPEFAALITQLADAGVFAETGMTKADIEQNLPMLGMMAPMIFQGLTVGNQVSIGVDDNMIYNQSTDFTWDLSGLIQMAAMSGQLPEGLDASAPVAVSLKTSVTNSDFGAEQTIEAPADAMMIPVESLMQGATTAP